MSLEVRDPEMMWKLMKQINRLRTTPSERLMRAIRESGGVTGNEEVTQQEVPSRTLQDVDGNTTSEVSNVYIDRPTPDDKP